MQMRLPCDCWKSKILLWWQGLHSGVKERFGSLLPVLRRNYLSPSTEFVISSAILEDRRSCGGSLPSVHLSV
jgi:hypothetical protein